MQRCEAEHATKPKNTIFNKVNLLRKPSHLLESIQLLNSLQFNIILSGSFFSFRRGGPHDLHSTRRRREISSQTHITPDAFS